MRSFWIIVLVLWSAANIAAAIWGSIAAVAETHALNAELAELHRDLAVLLGQTMPLILVDPDMVVTGVVAVNLAIWAVGATPLALFALIASPAARADEPRRRRAA